MVETFESLIADHQNLVTALAKRIHRKLPRFIAFEDVLSYGQLGLTQAARTYQPVEGAEFATFAHYRISGAIYDGLARMNWNSRSQLRRQKAMSAANAELEARSCESGNRDTEGQARNFFDTVEGLATVYHFSTLATEENFQEQVEDESAQPEELAIGREMAGVLREALDTLDEDERKLIEMTYFEDKSLAEAAAEMGKSRSWGCRFHSKILKKLGACLGDREGV